MFRSAGLIVLAILTSGCFTHPWASPPVHGGPFCTTLGYDFQWTQPGLYDVLELTKNDPDSRFVEAWPTGFFLGRHDSRPNWTDGRVVAAQWRLPPELAAGSSLLLWSWSPNTTATIDGSFSLPVDEAAVHEAFGTFVTRLFSMNESTSEAASEAWNESGHFGYEGSRPDVPAYRVKYAEVVVGPDGPHFGGLINDRSFEVSRRPGQTRLPEPLENKHVAWGVGAVSLRDAAWVIEIRLPARKAALATDERTFVAADADGSSAGRVMGAFQNETAAQEAFTEAARLLGVAEVRLGEGAFTPIHQCVA